MVEQAMAAPGLRCQRGRQVPAGPVERAGAAARPGPHSREPRAEGVIGSADVS